MHIKQVNCKPRHFTNRNTINQKLLIDFINNENKKQLLTEQFINHASGWLGAGGGAKGGCGWHILHINYNNRLALYLMFIAWLMKKELKL